MVIVAVSSMTAALGLYVAAYLLAPHKHHIFVACIAFSLDLYATYLMETQQIVAISGGRGFLIFHIIVSMSALLAFIALAIVGSLKKRKPHVFIAKYVFFPIWITSYISGIYLISSS